MLQITVQFSFASEYLFVHNNAIRLYIEATALVLTRILIQNPNTPGDRPSCRVFRIDLQ